MGMGAGFTRRSVWGGERQAGSMPTWGGDSHHGASRRVLGALSLDELLGAGGAHARVASEAVDQRDVGPRLQADDARALGPRKL